ncbi:MAG: hypothetical protein HYU28_08585 [Actinobacteria bacterium]|nr:hypothetical protein [Actinomycetota bacterium]
MRRLVTLVVAAMVVTASPATSWASGTRDEYTGASNDGNSVSVSAGEVSTSPGGGGPGGAPARGGPSVDYRALYDGLALRMEVERFIEGARRTDEHHRMGDLYARYDHCVAQANHWESQIYQRVLVVEWVPKQVRIPIPAPYRMREVHWHRVRVFRHWISYPHLHEWVTWRIHWITVTVWDRVERWETRFNVFAAFQTMAYRGCAQSTANEINRLGREITERRDAWERRWHDLNERAHDAWRHFNTSCRTIREIGDYDVQRCSYPEWRSFPGGGFDRQIYVPPVAPPTQVVLQARDLITPGSPVIRMSPRVEWEQIVHLPSWLWVDPSAWEAETARAQAGRAWAEATATPTRVVWQMGNGDSVTCNGPGTPYNEARHESTQRTGCSYTYGQSSAGEPNDAYTVTATLVYDVTWQGSGGAGGSLGSITRSANVPVRVAEIQALVTDVG